MNWQDFREPYPETPLGDSDPSPPHFTPTVSPTLPSDFFTFDTETLSSDLARHRESVSSSSGSSVCEPASPAAHGVSPGVAENAVAHGEADSEDAPWNLVAYHIPWGPGYEGYEAGTLPGPEGACIFLRSPTPLKRQRTSQACDKCRERKAKCSGARPSCTRCLTRGLACVYGPSATPDAQANPTRSPSRRPSHPAPSGHPKPLKTSTRTRMRRKSSFAESESSPGSAGLPAGGLELTGVSQGIAFFQDLGGDWNDGSRKYSNHPIPEGGFQPSVPGGMASSPDANSLSHEFSELSRPRDIPFSEDTSSLLYAHSLSGLETYRFPPPDDGKDITMPSMYSLTPSAANDSGVPSLMPHASACRGLDLIWRGVELSGGPNGQELSFTSSLPSASGKTFLNSLSQDGLFANTIPFRPSEQYEAAAASFSHGNMVQFGNRDGGFINTHFSA